MDLQEHFEGKLWEIFQIFLSPFRFLPFLMPAGSEKTLNLNTLRTFRVLRPLKLVSGVPSEWRLLYSGGAKGTKMCCKSTESGFLKSKRTFQTSFHLLSSLGLVAVVAAAAIQYNLVVGTKAKTIKAWERPRFDLSIFQHLFPLLAQPPLQFFHRGNFLIKGWGHLDGVGREPSALHRIDVRPPRRCPSFSGRPAGLWIFSHTKQFHPKYNFKFIYNWICFSLEIKFWCWTL